MGPDMSQFFNEKIIYWFNDTKFQCGAGRTWLEKTLKDKFKDRTLYERNTDYETFRASFLLENEVPKENFLNKLDDFTKLMFLIADMQVKKSHEKSKKPE